jgi:zinc ribbon protein
VALIECPECGKKISDKASACPACGNPMGSVSAANQETGTYCPSCKVRVAPAVTSVGGGSCSVGKRETWKCPQCRRVLHKSGCFVATATYGDEDAVEVKFLRAFRDQVLKRSLVGRFFTRAYYKCSPYVARAVELSPAVQKASRYCLDIVVALIERFTDLRRTSFRAPLP